VGLMQERRLMTRRIYAVDVGSTRCDNGRTPRFAWARVDPDAPNDVMGHSDISLLATALAADLNEGVSVALGFEAPLFIPVPALATSLCCGRKGEGSRSFAAPVGLTVCALAVHEAAWLLRAVKRLCRRDIRFRVDESDWPPRDEGVIFCWEAFVSQGAHADTHLKDAATAAMHFLREEDRLQASTSITAEHPFSLIGAAALWAGVAEDLSLLHKSTVVIRPTLPFDGIVRELAAPSVSLPRDVAAISEIGDEP
jgi:hypothetical protein